MHDLLFRFSTASSSFVRLKSTNTRSIINGKWCRIIRAVESVAECSKRERVYIEVTATTLPDGRVEPRFIKWRDGRVFPVAAWCGESVGARNEPHAELVETGEFLRVFNVYIGDSMRPRKLYLEAELSRLQRWFVLLERGDLPESANADICGASRLPDSAGLENKEASDAEARPKSLAGKCGIPLESEREYVKPVWDCHHGLERLELANGRTIRVARLIRTEEFGRSFYGNLCTHYVYRERGTGEVIDLWSEYGKWFVCRRMRN